MSRPNEPKKLPTDFDLSTDFPRNTFEEWKEKLTSDLKGIPYEKLISKTYEGIDLKPIYSSADLKDIPFVSDLPGTASNVRSNQFGEEKLKEWNRAQIVLGNDAEISADELNSDLQKGQNAIYLTLSLSDRLSVKESELEEGLNLTDYDEFRLLFEKVDFRNTNIFLNAGLAQLKILSNLKKFINDKKRGFDCLHGSVEAAPLSLLAQFGGLVKPLDKVIADLGQAIDFIEKNNIDFKTIGVHGFVYHNSGASAVEELAISLAEAVEYINLFNSEGRSPEQILPRIKFTVGTGGNFFMEIAKLRALRILWQNICDKFNLDPSKNKMNIHAVNSFVNKTIYDPHVNILRSTTESFAAVVGGADIITVLPFDSVYSVAGALGRRIAKNTHIILEEESHLNSVIDPAGGSYYVESLTKEIAEKAWTLFQSIEEDGGFLANLRNGKLQNMVEETVEKRRKDFNKRKSVLVGTNMYANPKEGTPSNLKDIDIEDIIITNVGDSKFPEKVRPFRQFRLAAEFESLRVNVDEWSAEKHERPKLLLGTMGKLKDFKARADFSRAFFEPAGFEIIYPNGFDSTKELLESVAEHNPSMIVICSTDDKYPDLVPEITTEIKKLNFSPILVLAGYPKDKVEDYKRNGIDEFIYLGADVFTINANILAEIGVEL